MPRFSLKQFLLILLLVSTEIGAFQEEPPSLPSPYVNAETWDQVKDYMIPDDHPAKRQLDRIFNKSRAFADDESMKTAGFFPAKPQPITKVIVTKHPKLKGYIIKAYLDEQDYPGNQPEYRCWVMRVLGSKLIRKSIKTHNYVHLFKVPRKWIYLLPDEPSPPSHYLRKTFILIEDDMNLFNEELNNQLWGSTRVTKERLDALFTITTELGLYDCTKPSNCPFSRDGRNAFVDTQIFHIFQVKYHMLIPFLSPEMQKYWKTLIKTK